MLRVPLHPALAFALAALFSTACAGNGDGESAGDEADAVAEMAPLMGSGVEGTVRFTYGGEGEFRLDVDLVGLTPGLHGLHIHEFGDCSADDGTSAGGHFNPDAHMHGAADDGERHAGDLGNIDAADDGKASLSRTLDTAYFSLGGGKYDVRGRAVIVHAMADDFGQPLGNAGGRVACGVIQAATGDVAPVLGP
ncbi:MAG: superoxide dismutase family protein [Nannocystaceae bacterium]